MADKPKLIFNAEALAYVATTSVVATTWLTPTRLGQGVQWYDLQVDLSSAAALLMELASTSAGSAWATFYFNSGSNLLALCGYGFSFMCKASNYFNFKFDASVTVKQMMIAQRLEW